MPLLAKHAFLTQNRKQEGIDVLQLGGARSNAFAGFVVLWVERGSQETRVLGMGEDSGPTAVLYTLKLWLTW
jgi:hypothetical protein